MKEKLGGKLMAEFASLRSKTYSYLIKDDDDDENKKAKVTKTCVVKRKPKFEENKKCLEAT